MKMVKSLLLGTAAGFVAIAGAQAADLPVKAKPVQYVKICSLYGAGFYYIPGTDMCLKIGGWVRLEIAQNYNGSMTTGPMAGDVNNRTTNDEVWRSRGYITADARNQTEYGTVRSYIAVGLNGNDVSAGGDVISANRAFIQWAGFTFGLATSFYDFYASPATAYFGSYPGSDTGDGGQKVIGYTAQFGNGFSGTLAAEVARRTQVLNADSNLGMNFNQIINGAGTGFGVASPSSYEGFDIPDVVANLRVDQAWGSAQVMAAWHRVGANYYTNTTFFPSDGAGHPGNENGYAIGAGIKLLNPSWGPGDYLQAMISYTKGASKYNFQNPNFNHGIRSGDSIGFGVMSDAVYGGDLRPRDNTTSLNLTETLAINAAYEHFWNPAWRTSVYGGWAEVNYNDQANAMLCVNQGFGNGRTGTFAVALPGCDQDWSVWWVGTRTQWNVTKDFYMGLDVIYQKLNTMSEPDLARGFSQFRMTNFHALRFLNDDQDNLGFRFRVHRDFYP